MADDNKLLTAGEVAALKPVSHLFVQFKRIWRNYSPGEFASFPLVPRRADGTYHQEVGKGSDDPPRDVKFLGDRLKEQMDDPDYRTAVKVPVLQAMQHLGPKAMLAHGYDKAEIKAALEKADEALKTKFEGYARGEKEREIKGIVEQPRVELRAHESAPAAQPS